MGGPKTHAKRHGMTWHHSELHANRGNCVDSLCFNVDKLICIFHVMMMTTLMMMLPCRCWQPLFPPAARWLGKGMCTTCTPPWLTVRCWTQTSPSSTPRVGHHQIRACRSCPTPSLQLPAGPLQAPTEPGIGWGTLLHPGRSGGSTSCCPAPGPNLEARRRTGIGRAEEAPRSRRRAATNMCASWRRTCDGGADDDEPSTGNWSVTLIAAGHHTKWDTFFAALPFPTSHPLGSNPIPQQVCYFGGASW